MLLERCEAREVFAGDLASDIYWQSAWQNPAVPADVVPDGIVSPADLLRIANDLAENGEHALIGEALAWEDGPEGESAEFEFLDATGDGWVTRADFEAVLDVLERLSDDATGLPLEDISARDGTQAPARLAATSVDITDSLPDSLSISTTPPSGLPGEGLPNGGPAIDNNAGDENTAAVTMVCINVPVLAGPIPTMVVDNSGVVHRGNWRPAWTPLDDLAHQGIVIDDFDSPYIAPGNWQAYNDDENKVAPKFIDVSFVDDSHFAWLEIVGYRSYFVGTSVENVANLTPVANGFHWQETVSVTNGTTITNTVTAQVGFEMGAELEGIGTKLQGLTSGSISISNQALTTTTIQMTIDETIPACSVVGLYAMTRVVELQVDYAFMDDTVLGPMYGYMREMGRGIVRTVTAAGHRTEIASGTLVPRIDHVVPPAILPLSELMRQL